MALETKPSICMFVLNPYLNDGRVRRTCRYLSERGYRITVIAESPSGEDDYLEIDGVGVYRLNNSGLPTTKGRFIKYMTRAAIKAADIKADIYHAFDLDTLLPAFIASVLNRGKLLYEAHEYYVGIQALLNRPFTKSIWSILERLLIHKADRVITVNQSIADKLVSRYAIPTPDVIYSCTNPIITERSSYLRERYNIPPDKLIVLYTGILREGQGLMILPELFSKTDKAVMVLVGDGPLLMELESKSNRLNVEERMIFAGKVDYDELEKYYNSADVGILLMEPIAENNRYALPNKFFGYLSAGLPVIVSDIPELKRFVDTYNLGLVISPQVQEAVYAVEKIASETSLYERYRRNAIDFSKEYTWDKEASKYPDIYAELTGS
ncbi:MAG: glycosyltransferase [candidate division Zixibacteria bacterium]|nr:glycosyltransferase [candidate division Zixibacteria bacterium]